MNYYKSYKFPIGDLTICEDGHGICGIYFAQIPEKGIEKNTLIIERTAFQLEEYFKGKRENFDIPLSMQGTAFQKKVWQQLQEIPYGETTTYKEVAISIGNPNACRGVGMANHRNPIPIIIPCHRVIGSDGKLTGYNGGMDKKKMLLEIERGKNGTTK